MIKVYKQDEIVPDELQPSGCWKYEGVEIIDLDNPNAYQELPYGGIVALYSFEKSKTAEQQEKELLESHIPDLPKKSGKHRL